MSRFVVRQCKSGAAAIGLLALAGSGGACATEAGNEPASEAVFARTTSSGQVADMPDPRGTYLDVVVARTVIAVP